MKLRFSYVVKMLKVRHGIDAEVVSYGGGFFGIGTLPRVQDPKFPSMSVYTSMTGPGELSRSEVVASPADLYIGADGNDQSVTHTVEDDATEDELADLIAEVHSELLSRRTLFASR